MLTKEIEDALNAQLNYELLSAYIYLSMSAQFTSENLDGFAHWMSEQAKEEVGHAMKFYSFINDRQGRVALQAIDKPQFDWKSPLDAFESALEHEKSVTKRINDLVDLALKHGDHATNIFLQWFVTEQIEEESSVDEVIEQLKKMGDFKGGLYLLDRELATRSSAE